MKAYTLKSNLGDIIFVLVIGTLLALLLFA
jgi:hypothetical protein